MAPKTRKAGATATRSTRSTAAKPKAPAATAETESGSAEAAKAAEQKREAREAQTAEQQATIVKRVINGDEKLAAVAKDLKITSGKAAFLIMLHRVAEGEVPTITGKNDEALLRAINVARNKADEYSSWGWLAARSGKSEGFIKTGLEGLGLYTPRAENIASKRSESSKPAATAASGKKPAPKKKTVRGNA